MEKKASLNLSIEVIIIVVIAFVVLGLGLGFVKGTFKDITGTTQEVQANIKEQILNDMRTSNQKLSVPGQITLERGEETVQGIGVLNTGTTGLKYGVKITPIKKLVPGEDPKNDPVVINKEIVFFYSELIDQKLSATEGKVLKVTISATNQASGTYLYKAEVFEDITIDDSCDPEEDTVSENCKVYDTQSFFVKII